MKRCFFQYPIFCSLALANLAILLCFILPCNVFAEAIEYENWQELEPGLQLAEFSIVPDGDNNLIILRIDPNNFNFTLHTVSEEDTAPKTLAEWADKYNLVAAINASMYLPDASTSTGYMRNGEHINNGRISQNFGAFFVAGAKTKDLPSAALLDRDADNWESKLPNYKIVVQNYRMINTEKRILWSAGGPLYAISAVGQDTAGRIFFIHCREAVEAYFLCQKLLSLPLNLRSLMYVEGGAQAGLALRSKILSRNWAAPHIAGILITGQIHATLPNIIGVKRK